MQPINLIEYTLEFKPKKVKIVLPKFVVEWDAVYEHALQRAYAVKLWDIHDIECVETIEKTEEIKL